MASENGRESDKGDRVPKRTTSPRPAAIRELPPFDAETFLNSVGEGRSVLSLPANRRIFGQGDACGGIYFVKKGRVKLTVISDQGKEGVVAILGPDEFFGEGCLAGQPTRLATATTITSAEVVKVELPTMVRTLAAEPNLSQFFIAHLLARNARLEADLVDQLFNSSEKRLARVLLQLTNFGKEGRLETVRPKISQDVLAAKVGTTRSRINLFMNKFRKLGLIEYNGDLKVHSALLSVIVHD